MNIEINALPLLATLGCLTNRGAFGARPVSSTRTPPQCGCIHNDAAHFPSKADSSKDFTRIGPKQGQASSSHDTPWKVARVKVVAQLFAIMRGTRLFQE